MWNGAGKKGVFISVGSCVQWLIFILVAPPGTPLGWFEYIIGGDFSDVVCYFVKSCEPRLPPPFGEEGPLQVIKHLCHAASPLVVIQSHSGGPALDGLHRLDPFGGIWVPDGGTIFQVGPDQRFIAGGLDPRWTVGQISPNDP